MSTLAIVGLVVVGTILYIAAIWAIDKIATKYLGQ
jgi:preprotein translocase subunit SecE